MSDTREPMQPSDFLERDRLEGNPPPADPIARARELAALAGKASAPPWAYRPHPHDDWGWVRDANFNLAAIACSPATEDEKDAHRRAKTDPHEANAAFIAFARNHAEQICKALEEATAKVAHWQDMYRRAQNVADREDARAEAAEAEVARLTKAPMPADVADLIHVLRTSALTDTFSAYHSHVGQWMNGAANIMKSQAAEVARLTAEVVRKDAALNRIAKWFGEFPDTGERWPSGTPLSYAAAYGSNGERDYIREIARTAAAPTTPADGEG